MRHLALAVLCVRSVRHLDTLPAHIKPARRSRSCGPEMPLPAAARAAGGLQLNVLLLAVLLVLLLSTVTATATAAAAETGANTTRAKKR